MPILERVDIFVKVYDPKRNIWNILDCVCMTRSTVRQDYGFEEIEQAFEFHLEQMIDKHKALAQKGGYRFRIDAVEAFEEEFSTVAEYDYR